MSRFLRNVRNKIRESLKKEGKGKDQFMDRIAEIPSGRFNKVTQGGKRGFRAVANFLKIKF